MGAFLKGVGSLFPPNTIANKLATGTKIDKSAIKNALSDVSGSLQGTRGILGGSTPAINVLGSIPGGNAVKTALGALSRPPVATTTLGGIATLAPSNIANSSALASQASVSQSLYAGATGSIPDNTPVYAGQFSQAVDNNKGIKEQKLNADGSPKKPISVGMILGGIAVAYFFFFKK